MKPEFNNGFVTAIALFLEHKDNMNNSSDNLDNRLYAGSDHLLEMEIPSGALLSQRLKCRIRKWREKCLCYRLKKVSSDFIDELFSEGENILISIDNTAFCNKKVRING